MCNRLGAFAATGRYLSKNVRIHLQMIRYSCNIGLISGGMYNLL